MNILVTLDKKYLFPLAVMLESVGKTGSGRETDVFVVHSALEVEDFVFLKKAVEPFAFIKLHNVKIEAKWFKNTPVIERLPAESFYRLLAFEFLPDEVDKVLYLDPDILVLKPLDELYDLDLKGNILAAANHTKGLVETMNKVRLGLSKEQKYVNSGVMLMDIKKMRETLTAQSVIEAANDNLQKLWMGDQDLANILFADKTLYLDELAYNLDERTLKRNRKTFGKKEIAETTAIIHYNGKYKPWLDGYKGELDEYYPPIKEKGPKPKKRFCKQLKSIWHIVKGTKKQRVMFCVWTAVVVLAVACLFLFGKAVFGFVAKPDELRGWLERFGVFDELVFLGLRALQTMIKIIPSAALEIASGYAYGVVKGTALCVLGNAIGSVVEIFLVRKFGRRLVEKFVSLEKIEAFERFRKNGNAYAVIFFIYLLPFVPKDMLTYVVGLTGLKPWLFLSLTTVARIPSVLPFTLSGSALASERYWLAGITLVGIVLFAVIAFSLYKIYLKKKKEE